jgi:hypothetical protein
MLVALKVDQRCEKGTTFVSNTLYFKMATLSIVLLRQIPLIKSFLLRSNKLQVLEE